MYYLMKSTSIHYFNAPTAETEMKMIAKSTDITKLQSEIKRMYDNAEEIWQLDSEDCINGASLEEIEELKDEVEYFEKDRLSILKMFPEELDVETEIIEYHIVKDDGVREV